MIKAMVLAPAALAALLSLAAGPVLGAQWGPWEKAEEPDSRPVTSLSRMTSPFRLSGLLAIRGYQFLIRPGLPGRCQFQPSCSRYAFEAIARRGLLNGTLMGAERVTRCHGFAALGDYRALPHGRLQDPAADKPAPAPWLAFLGL